MDTILVQPVAGEPACASLDTNRPFSSAPRASAPCLGAFKIRIERERWSPVSDTAQKTPLKGLRFESPEEARKAHLDRWVERSADTRFHATTKRQVAAMFIKKRNRRFGRCLWNPSGLTDNRPAPARLRREHWP